MPLKLYSHPLSSFCWKALISVYENGAPFDLILVDLMNEETRRDYRAISPLLKIPALVDEERGRTVLESTVITEYLDTFYPGKVRLLPDDPDKALRARELDRLYDGYIQHPMQKIVADRLRPAGDGDDWGVRKAQADLHAACAMMEASVNGAGWALGETFTLADCAAAPALFYANAVAPFGSDFPNLAGYLARLMARPSFARTLEEAEPYFDLFPLDRKPSLAPPTGSKGAA